MFVALGDKLVGLIAVADTLRPESAQAVAQLKALGLEVWMLTGDNAATAHAIARQADVDHVHAEVLPDQKAATVRALQAEGKIVAMVGDGINDAPALAQADLGIAIGTGTDVAMAASDVTLIGGDLRGIVTAIALFAQHRVGHQARPVLGIRVKRRVDSRRDGCAVPGIWCPADPVLAAAAMAMSSVSVVTNALRLRNFKPEHSQ